MTTTTQAPQLSGAIRSSGLDILSSTEWDILRPQESLYPEELAIRRTYPRAFEAWTADEEFAMVRARLGGGNLSEIATNHGREPSAMRTVLRRVAPHLVPMGEPLMVDDAPEGYDVVKQPTGGILGITRGMMHFLRAKSRALSSHGALFLLEGCSAWLPRRRMDPEAERGIVAVAIPTAGLPTARSRRSESIVYSRERRLFVGKVGICDRDGDPLHIGDLVQIAIDHPGRPGQPGPALWPQDIQERLAVIEGAHSQEGGRDGYLQVRLQESDRSVSLLLTATAHLPCGSVVCEIKKTILKRSIYHALVRIGRA